MPHQDKRPLPFPDHIFRSPENDRVSLEDVCTAAARTAGNAETGLALAGRQHRWETVYATGQIAHHLEELQLVFGEGPVVDALSSGGPVFAADLAGQRSRSRWPVLAAASVETGARAAFAFPLRRKRPWVGTLTVYRAEPGELSNAQSVDTLRFAAVALQLLTSDIGPGPPESMGDTAWPVASADPNHDPTLIYQATGVLAAQKRVDVDTAFAILRAQAYASGTRLVSVAKATIETYLPLDEGAHIR